VIILDTNVASVLMVAGHPDLATITAWRDTLADRDVRITAITRAEIAQGIAVLPEGAKRASLAAAASDFFAATAKLTLPFDAAAADAYARIVAKRRSLGQPIGVLDAQIAAIATAVGATVATRDVKGFADCGVGVVNPYSE
jgi:predicted nucleic acid-binding protein